MRGLNAPAGGQLGVAVPKDLEEPAHGLEGGDGGRVVAVLAVGERHDEADEEAAQIAPERRVAVCERHGDMR